MSTEESAAPRSTATLDLAAEPNAVMLTRAFVRHAWRAWGFREPVEDAELIASELATNAVQATSAVEPSYFVNGRKLPAIIRVQLRLFDGFMLVCVWDRSPREPTLITPEDIAEGGRGLVIVDNLSRRWGWETVHPYSSFMGKVVWAEIAVPSFRLTAAGLPARISMVDRYEPVVSLDPETLGRIHIALKRW